MSTLLPFHKSILENVHDPATSELLIVARGLGLRRLVCTLLKIYDSPQNLVLLINASLEENGIGEELGLMGCRNPGLRIVGYEMVNKDRQELYKQGGLISVTSRILVVDMLQGDIPTHLITGLIVMHAEKVTALALEAFIVRLYREKNKTGFLKAFSDEPEHIMSGLSPLKNIMKELQLRKVHIYPRFQEDIKQSLERRRADVVELSQPMTAAMSDIHHAIIQCMSTTISELKRSNTSLDLDDFNVENAYFRSFDILVRKQLDSVWHKVGPRTKQLVNDLGTLRRLLYYLLTYDPLHFHAYLETLIATNSVSTSGSGPRQHQSPWLLTDAAHIIFQVAKRRCYILSRTLSMESGNRLQDDGDEEDWAALDDLESGLESSWNKGKEKQEEEEEERPGWLPRGMEPVLEELPKWNLLADVIQEAEEEIIRQAAQAQGKRPFTDLNQGTNTILVMASSNGMCASLTEFLGSINHDTPAGVRGRKMMLRKLRMYLWWKARLLREKNSGGDVKKVGNSMVIWGGGFREEDGNGTGPTEDGKISEALKKKDRDKAERAKSRRRVRGGVPSTSSRVGNNDTGKKEVVNVNAIEVEAFSQFWESAQTDGSEEGIIDLSDVLIQNTGAEAEFDEYYGLVVPEETVIVRAYSDDTDDRVLEEVKPKFIVMVEPCMEFVRRIEVYKNSNPGMPVRVYHMVYGNSCEEQKYLATIRREKESFEKLIKERGTMLMPLLEEHREGASDAIIKTISTRVAGGRRINELPSQVIIDMREFRSSLPSLLHASGQLVIPATLTVGDYILTPEICVERKSLSDLVSSFNNGRLYTQCELMSVHYRTPVLLIEFEEDKAFSLDIISDIKNYAKPTGKYAQKQRKPGASSDMDQTALLQSKLCLLILTFPRVRIVWSSSPYATAEIFKDLKSNNPEPDPSVAISMGADGDPEAGKGINAAAEELLRCLPGITTKNVKHVMGKINTVSELCDMDLLQVQELLGAEPGKACWEFMHKGEEGRR